VTPLDLVEPVAAVGTAGFGVAVVASHPNGIVPDSVRVRVDGQELALSPAGGRWQSRARFASDQVPAGGRTVPVVLRAVSGDGSVHERAGQIRAIDSTVPAVLTFTPSDGAKVVGTAVGVAFAQ
jgi:hypothetical protein